MEENPFEVTSAALTQFFGQDFEISLDDSNLVSNRTYEKKSDDEKAKFFKDLATNFVEQGIVKDRKDGLVAWLSKSEDAKERFLEACSGFVVCFAPPGRIVVAPRGTDANFGFEDNGGTMNVRIKVNSVGATKRGGWGPKVDQTLGLNCLLPGYITTAEAAVSVTNGYLSSMLEDVQVVVDWEFCQDERFMKKTWAERKKAIEGLGKKIVKDGMQQKAAGLGPLLEKSKRAQEIFREQCPNGIMVGVAVDNKVQGRGAFGFELDGGFLRITAKLNGLEKSEGWGPSVDKLLDLNVEDEKAAKIVQAALADIQGDVDAALGHHVHVEVDWSFLDNDRWKKGDAAGRAAKIKDFGKKFIPPGFSGKKDSLLPWLGASGRATAEFLSQVSCIRIAVAVDGRIKVGAKGTDPFYQVQVHAGVLEVKVKMADMGKTHNGWGPKVDFHCNLFGQDEAAVREAEDALAAMQVGVNVVVDWNSFLAHNMWTRKTPKERVPLLKSLAGKFVKGGLTGNRGLANSKSAAEFEDTCTTVVIRTENRVNARGAGSKEYKMDLCEEGVMVLTLKLSGMGVSESWEEKFKSHYSKARQPAFDVESIEECRLLIDSDAPPLDQEDVLPMHKYMGENVGIHDAPKSNNNSGSSAPSLGEIKGTTARKPVRKPVTTRKPVPKRVVKKTPPRRVAKKTPPRRVAKKTPPRRVVKKTPPRKVVKKTPLRKNAPAKASSDVNLGSVPPAAHQIAKDCAALMSKFNSTNKCSLELCVDWGFVDDILAYPEKDHRNMLLNFVKRVVSPVLAGVGKLRHGKGGQNYVKAMECLTKLDIQFDGSNSVQDTSVGGNAHYFIALEGDAMIVRCNLKDHMKGCIPQLPDKLQITFQQCFNVFLEILMDEALVVAKQQSDALSRVVGQEIPISISFDSFVSDPAFLGNQINAVTLKNWTKTFTELKKNMTQLVQGVSRGCKNDIYRNAVKERVTSIFLVIDPSNKIRASVAPLDWQLRDIAEGVEYSYNLRGSAKAAQAAPNKWLAFLQVAVAQEVKKSKTTVEASIKAFSLIKEVPAELEWDFLDTKEFLALKEADRVMQVKKITPFIAKMVKHLNLVASKNKEVVLNKLTRVRFHLDGTNKIGSEVTLDTSGVLLIDHNLNTITKPASDIPLKIDFLLDVTMANSEKELSVEMDAISNKFKLATKLDVRFGIDLSFTKHPDFANLQPQQKKTHLKLLTKVATELGASKKPVLSSLMCELAPVGRTVTAVIIGCDPQNSIDDAVSGTERSKNYSVKLNDEGVLQVVINMRNVNDQVPRSAWKINAQVLLADARRFSTEKTIRNSVKQAEDTTGNSIVVDWGSFQDPAFVNTVGHQKLVFAIEHIKLTMSKVGKTILNIHNGSPAGAADLENKIKQVVVKLDCNQPYDWNAIWDKEAEQLTLNFSLAYFRDVHKPDIVEWQLMIEWALISTVEVEKFHAMNRMKEIRDKLQKQLGIELVMDWRWMDNPKFRELERRECRRLMRAYSMELIDKVAVQGILAVAAHPVGEQGERDSIDKCVVCFHPHEDTTHRLNQASNVVVKKPNMTVNFRDMDSAIAMDYKSRIEFEMDLVVSIAASKAEERRSTVEKKIGIPIEVMYKRFTQLEEFKWLLQPDKQAAIVNTCAAKIPERVLLEEDGLAGVRGHQVGKDKIASLKKIEVQVVTSEEAAVFTVQPDGTLLLCFALGSVLSFDKAIFKPDLSFALGVLRPVYEAEAEAKLAQTQAVLEKAIKGKMPLAIDWDSFLACTEKDSSDSRYRNAHYLGGDIVRDVLLGYDGIVAIMKHCSFKNVEVRVNKGYSVECPADTLIVNLGVPEISKQKIHGCRWLVDECLKLRPKIEEEAKEYVRQNNILPVQKSLAAKGIKVELAINWDSVAEWHHDYYAHHLYIGSFVSPLLDESEGLPWLEGHEAWGRLDRVEEIFFSVDQSCTVHPPQVRYTAKTMCCELEQGVLEIRLREDWLQVSSRGVGTLLEWLLTPAFCQRQEDERLDALRRQLIEQEENYRESRMRSFQRDCERNVDGFNRAVENYNRELKKIDDASKRDCGICKGNGRSKCSGCGGKGTSFKKVCRNCKGSGRSKNRCGHCKGTGNKAGTMKQPTFPKQKPNPSRPTFSALNSTDWLAMARQQSAFSLPGKNPLQITKKPRPGRPKFSTI